jgi:heptosyltransferase-1
MRILFVKLTSMGDLTHALPALTDAMHAVPNISFDWAIEKSFLEIASWHPAVKTILPTSHRQWRKHPWQTLKNGEISHFIKSLRKETYDLVIDGQTSTKSAIITLLSKGTRCGLDKHSAREAIASYAYQKHFSVDKKLHAITRLRMLFAQVLQYPYVDNQPDYGIASHVFPALTFELPKPYVVLVHNASWESKLWPEKYWHQLIYFAAEEGLNVVLPWGNASEKERAERLIQGHANALVLPFCSLSEHAQILKNAVGAISCDTGLSHIAAALDVKAVTIYGSTSTELIGTTGRFQVHQEPDFSCVRCYQYTCNYNKTYHAESACMLANTPEIVWGRFKKLVEG